MNFIKDTLLGAGLILTVFIAIFALPYWCSVLLSYFIGHSIGEPVGFLIGLFIMGSIIVGMLARKMREG